MRYKKLQAFIFSLIFLISYFYIGFQSYLPIPEPTVLKPDIANAEPAVSYNVTFESWPPLGWSVVYAHTTSLSYTYLDFGVGAYGLYVNDTSNTEAYKICITRSYPFANTSYTAEGWFRPYVDDITKDFTMGFTIGGTSNASKIYFTGYRGSTNQLEVRVRDFTGDTITTLASSASTYAIQNDTWYIVNTTVTWTGSGIEVDVYLKNSTGNTLLTLENVALNDVFPIFGLALWIGSGQTGSLFCKNVTVTYFGSKNVPELVPIIDPDMETYDWVGAPMKVFYEHSDGNFYPYDEDGDIHITVRWHGESSGTGDATEMFKINGDPRDGNWTSEGIICTRSQLGWSYYEEFNLIILNNGTWIGFAAGGTTAWYIHRLVSNDQGSTWTDKGTLFGIQAKENHIWVDQNGTIYMTCREIGSGDLVRIYKSNDLGVTWELVSTWSGYYKAALYKYGGVFYVLATNRTLSADPNNNYRNFVTDLYTSTNLVDFTFVKNVFQRREDLPFTLYQNGFTYANIILYNQYLLVVAEGNLIDHDPNDDINDQTQRHVIVMYDPVESFVTPSVNTSIPGTLTVGYSPPEVLAVNLYNTSWAEVSSIDPYVEYWLNVTIRHNNTLYSLENITFYFYASGSNWNSADDPNTHATFVWDNDTKQYSLVGPTGTTWTVNTANCRVPDQSQNTGTFTLAFNASKIALMGTWYINVTAWGAQDLSDSLTISVTVNFYAEIKLTDTSFQFSLSVGAENGTLSVPTDGDIDFSVICNAPYKISFYTDGNWTRDGYEIDITNTNYFIGDDDSNPTEGTETGINPFAIHPTPDKATPYASQAVTQDDINGDTYAIYLFQTVPSGTPVGTYTLILYIEVAAA